MTASGGWSVPSFHHTSACLVAQPQTASSSAASEIHALAGRRPQQLHPDRQAEMSFSYPLPSG